MPDNPSLQPLCLPHLASPPTPLLHANVSPHPLLCCRIHQELTAPLRSHFLHTAEGNTEQPDGASDPVSGLQLVEQNVVASVISPDVQIS